MGLLMEITKLVFLNPWLLKLFCEKLKVSPEIWNCQKFPLFGQMLIGLVFCKHIFLYLMISEENHLCSCGSHFGAPVPPQPPPLLDMNNTKWCNGFYIECRQNFAKETFSYDEHLKS